MKAVVPTPQTTLVVLLGASEWPYSPEFQSSRAFANSANALKGYLLNPNQFGLPRENLLNLFDTDRSSDDIDIAVERFLKERISEMKSSEFAAKDILIYFIGHGGFVGGNSNFYLAIRRTRTNNPSASSIQVESLACNLKENARYLRRLIILDCCFAGAAFKAFQTEPAQVAIVQTIEAFRENSKISGIPTRGTSLLCSSRHNSPSILSPDGNYTMFTQALLGALSTGYRSRPNKLSLREMATFTTDVLHKMPNGKAPKPEIHSPDQSEGDVADTPFFPNLTHTRVWSSVHPGYLIFLLDQSQFMAGSFGMKNGERICDGVANVLNAFLNNIICGHTHVTADGQSEVRPRVDISMLGYRSGRVYSLLPQEPYSRAYLTLPELQANPLDIRMQKIPEMDDCGNIYDIEVPFPIWVRPKAVGDAPMCAALQQAKRLAEQWVIEHPDSYPPVVLHITAGVASDGDPLTPALQLRNVCTADGYVLLYTTLVANRIKVPVWYPSIEEDLPDDLDIKRLFSMSSSIPETGRSSLLSFLRIMSRTVPTGARGFVCSADAPQLLLPLVHDSDVPNVYYA